MNSPCDPKYHIVSSAWKAAGSGRHVCLCVHARACVGACVCAFVRACVSLCVYLCMCVCVRVRVIYMYIQMQIYICMDLYYKRQAVSPVDELAV